MKPAALLRLLRLASPALPVGSFSYSEGLEAAVDAGTVGDEAGALAWLSDQLELVLARGDLPALAQAHAAWLTDDGARLAALNAWVHATRESAELRRQSEQMGRSMLEWLRHDGATDRGRLDTLAALPPCPTWLLAFALAGAAEVEEPGAGSGAARADAEALLLAHAFGWAENQVQAALKAVPLGQAAGQRMLADLAGRIPGAVRGALDTDESSRQAFAPGLAIASARHETQYSRLFRS